MPEFSLGTISAGTMRPQDLIPSFLETLGSLGGTTPGDLECGTHIEYTDPANTSLLANLSTIDDDDPFWDSEEASWDLDALFDALQELCPVYVYFGAHPGDGSDYGFWPDIDSLEDDLRYAEPTDNPEEKIIDNDFIVQVSDHGNVTVMTLDREVLWSCV